MIVTAEKRTLKTNDVLSHPLGPRPWALDPVDGVITGTNKSTLACQGAGQKNMTVSDVIAQPCGRIIDEKCDQKTLAELTASVMFMVLQRIDVVLRQL